MNKDAPKIQNKEVTHILGKEDLHDYQLRAIEHIIRVTNSALFLDMGL